MAEWLVERGIGEDRALLVENGRAVATRLRLPGELHAGELVEARLVSRAAGSPRGVARTATGVEILLDRLPREACEGATLQIEITRAAIAERGRSKHPRGRLAASASPRAAARAAVFASGREVRRFPRGLWEEAWSLAWDGEVTFAGGSLLIEPTAAMTVVDIDGDAPPRDLALRAIPAIAHALRLFDCGGSIGIDFPTLQARADRRTVDEALAHALAEWPHERTAMNGFGFVQVVARLERASLLHRLAFDRPGAAARMALRRAELLDGPGDLLLTVPPVVLAALKSEWQADLSRRCGREVRVASDPAVAPEAGHAQLVAR